MRKLPNSQQKKKNNLAIEIPQILLENVEHFKNWAVSNLMVLLEKIRTGWPQNKTADPCRAKNFITIKIKKYEINCWICHFIKSD